MSEDELKDYVENRIVKVTFRAKDFSLEEMEIVDNYCKNNYGNNRKLMIMDLIRYKDDNLIFDVLNDKINLMYTEIYNKLNELKPSVKEESNSPLHWKGFSKKE